MTQKSKGHIMWVVPVLRDSSKKPNVVEVIRVEDQDGAYFKLAMAILPIDLGTGNRPGRFYLNDHTKKPKHLLQASDILGGEYRQVNDNSSD